MMIHKITSSVDYNWWLKHLNTQLKKNKNANFKSPKLISWILWDKTMAGKLMYIPIGDKQNYNFCRLQLVVDTFEHSTKKTKNSIELHPQ